MAAQAVEKTPVPPIDRAAADPRVTHEDEGEGEPTVKMRTACAGRPARSE